MMALNVGSFYAVLILHSTTFRDRGAPSTIILLSSALSWEIQSFIFNAKVAYDCLHVIFVMNSIRRRRGLDALVDQNEHEHDMNLAMSRAVQNLSHGFKVLLYVSLPAYLCFLLGVVAVVVVLSPLIITALWLQFFGNERDSNTILSSIIQAHQDNHRPQSDLTADIV